jgi:tRNA modification GTPase
MSDDTIFALSSGRPPAAIAVIRISGPRAHEAGHAIAGSLPEARYAAVRELRSATGELLDEALVLRFDGPASATGESLVELHCHGGRAVADAVLESLGGLDGLRLAQPGEFTRRSFENGRIDLTEAEGLADLLEAETDSQRRAALRLAEGGLRRQIEQWQDALVALAARAEVAIDYIDEHEVPDPALAADAGKLADELAEWLSRPRVEPLKDGVNVVIAGPPNSGKSSLLNALSQSDKAIVTDVEGTTRDEIDVPLSIDGVPIILTDTAGIRATAEPVERMGVARAERRVVTADILVWLGDPAVAPRHASLVQVHSRCDLNRGDVPGGSVPVSSKTGEGLALLLGTIGTRAAALLPKEGSIALNRRQAAHIEAAENALRRAAAPGDPVLAAEDLRVARLQFDQITGRAGIEDLLDALFGRFCLGK